MGVAGALEYNRDLFDAATVATPGRPPRRSCSPRSPGSTGARPRGSPICRCSTPPSAQQVLAEWNDTAVPRPCGGAAPRAVRGAGRAHAGGGGPGLRRGGSDLRRARRRATGWPATCAPWASGRRRAVGVCVERSPRLWSSACWRCSRRAGPTCRSIPAYPRERLAFMLEDSRGPPAADRAAHRRRAARREDRAAARAAGRPARPARPPGRRGCPGRPARQPGLRHLHVGLDRPAQGRRRRAPQRAPPCCAGRAESSRGTALASVVASTSSPSTSRSSSCSRRSPGARRWCCVDDARRARRSWPGGGRATLGQPTLLNTVPSAIAALVADGRAARAPCTRSAWRARRCSATLADELYRRPSVRARLQPLRPDRGHHATRLGPLVGDGGCA